MSYGQSSNMREQIKIKLPRKLFKDHEISIIIAEQEYRDIIIEIVDDNFHNSYKTIPVQKESP